MVIEKQAMDTEKDKFKRLQQEQRDLDASYRQSLKNKKEREEQEDNEEYLKQLKDKLWVLNGINYTSTRRQCERQLKVDVITR